MGHSFYHFIIIITLKVIKINNTIIVLGINDLFNVFSVIFSDFY